MARYGSSASPSLSEMSMLMAVRPVTGSAGQCGHEDRQPQDGDQPSAAEREPAQPVQKRGHLRSPVRGDVIVGDSEDASRSAS
jgi:hypothetical protein